MMKLLYIFGEMDSIDNYFVESDLDAAVTQFTNEHNSRMLRMAAEAYAIKGTFEITLGVSEQTSCHSFLKA